MASQLLAALRREIKLHPKIYLGFQILFFGWSIFWWRFPPAPGKAVLLLAVVAAIVTIQPQMTDNHRLAWLVIVFVLFFVEFRALNRDRAEALARERQAREAENAQFASILDASHRQFEETIAQSRKQFEATMAQSQLDTVRAQNQFAQTMARSDRIVAGVGDAIKAQTGGDSFAFITLTGPEPPILTFEKISHPNGPWMLVSITSHGKYPLRDVHAVMVDEEWRRMAIQEANKHPGADWAKTIDEAMQSGETRYQYPYLRPQSPEAPSGEVEAIGAYEMPQGIRKSLRIYFGSLNGYWNEVLHLGLVNGRWHQCLSVMGPTVKQAVQPFIWCDSDWPEGKALAEKDWVSRRAARTNIFGRTP